MSTLTCGTESSRAMMGSTDDRETPMSDETHEHHFQETKDGKANIDPKPLGKPESISQVLHDVAEGAAEFLEGKPPKGAKDSGHVEGADRE